MPIRSLDQKLINQIAAGEVIERPAAVVKELLENACDAGATEIEVWYEGSGIARLCVRDNGQGIPLAELPLAIARHATSKIASLSDLFQVRTLGFRGEALASIAAISEFCLTSRPADQDMAYAVTVEGQACQPTILPAAHPVGTTVVVANLFHNTPVRRKFLRSDKTEALHIEDTVRRLALSHFDVGFTLWAEEKKVFQLPPAATISQYHQRLQRLLQKQFMEGAIRIDCVQGPLHLWGWLGAPNYHRRQNDQQMVFVQERWVRDKVINHAIQQVYAPFMEPGVYPSFVLYLELPPDTVDVNVHPTKQEVRFHNPRQIHDFVESCVRQSIQQWVHTRPEPAPHVAAPRTAGAAVPAVHVSGCRDVAFLSHYRILAQDEKHCLINLQKASQNLLDGALCAATVRQAPLAVPTRWPAGKKNVAVWESLQAVLAALGWEIYAFSPDTLIITQIPMVLLGVYPLLPFMDAWFAALTPHSSKEQAIALAVRHAPPQIAANLTATELMPYLEDWCLARIAADLTAEVLTTVC